MSTDWESHLERWVAASVVDVEVAGRIRAWEREHAKTGGLRWPILIALAFGALLLGAGVLLFVSAHWDELPASQRMSLVVLMVGVFHVAGAVASEKFEGLAVALHAIGTISLGAGIAFAGQIFHLSAHWPAAILMWAVGAAITWALLRHWTHAAFTAILVPYWLSGEWWVWNHRDFVPIAAGVTGLCFTYLSARRGAGDSAVRKALAWIGGLALLPSAFTVAFENHHYYNWPSDWIAWLVATLGPLALAFALRGREAVWNAIAIAWSIIFAAISSVRTDYLPLYIWCAIGAAGLAAWGIRDGRAERINLGIAGFAITLLTFYFSSVMDKLGRSASLIGLGLLFLGGGWLLERTRRRLVARLHPEVA
jgi:uncharacterized membrane protein